MTPGPSNGTKPSARGIARCMVAVDTLSSEIIVRQSITCASTPPASSHHRIQCSASLQHNPRPRVRQGPGRQAGLQAASLDMDQKCSLHSEFISILSMGDHWAALQKLNGRLWQHIVPPARLSRAGSGRLQTFHVPNVCGRPSAVRARSATPLASLSPSAPPVVLGGPRSGQNWRRVAARPLPRATCTASST